MFWKLGDELHLKNPSYLRNEFGRSVLHPVGTCVVFLTGRGTSTFIVTKKDWCDKVNKVFEKKRSVRNLLHLFSDEYVILSRQRLYHPEVKEKGFKALI